MQVKAIWLRPRIMGRFLHMNEGLIFVAIIGAVVLWGILGGLIIVPALATLGAVGRYVRFRLMGLSPWPDVLPLPPPPPSPEPEKVASPRPTEERAVAVVEVKSR
jgi:hypothetical protein